MIQTKNRRVPKRKRAVAKPLRPARVIVTTVSGVGLISERLRPLPAVPSAHPKRRNLAFFPVRFEVLGDGQRMRGLQPIGGQPSMRGFARLGTKPTAQTIRLLAGTHTASLFRLPRPRQMPPTAAFQAGKQTAQVIRQFVRQQAGRLAPLFAAARAALVWPLTGNIRSLGALPVGCLSAALTIAYPLSPNEPLLFHRGVGAIDALTRDKAALQEYLSFRELFPELPTAPPKLDLSYLAYYAYSEVPPDEKPADTVRNALKDVPLGTPVEEIKRVCDLFGLDFGFMKAVAKIESDFDPKQRTGSYIGLFQLSNYEFEKYGSGDITNPRDNAIAAAYKFAIAAALFELDTHKRPTRSDLYLIHQQGTQGAAEHVSHPDRIAWKSMCATDEGRQKGEKWCKRAIWQNTLPAIKDIWKSVDNLTSGAFVSMWEQRVATFYARYADTDVDKAKTAAATAAGTAPSGAP